MLFLKKLCHASSSLSLALSLALSSCLISSCLEWMVEPTRLDGSSPDASRRPHIISNSYGCPTDEGCDPDTFQQILRVVRKAGIFMAVAAGNNGRDGCSVSSQPSSDCHVDEFEDAFVTNPDSHTVTHTPPFSLSSSRTARLL